MAGDTPKPNAARQLACSNCGAAIQIYSLSGVCSVGCANCGATSAVSEEVTSLLEKHKGKFAKANSVALPMGTKGKINGVSYQVRGMIRRGTEDDSFAWSEFFLFSPSHGTLWLSESDGHWMMYQVLAEPPASFEISSFELHGNEFRRYGDDAVKVLYAIGEFYWEVRPGDRTRSVEFLGPPEMLSVEVAEGEVNWSSGRYVNGSEIAAAFNVKLPRSRGSHPAMLPYRVPFYRAVRDIAFAFMIGLFLVQIVIAVAMRTKTLVSLVIDDKPAGEGYLSDPFTIPAVANLEVMYHAPLNNDWIELESDLVNVDTGDRIDISKNLEFYSGNDGGEYWSEGSQAESENLKDIPPGKYVLALNRSGGKTARAISFELRKNVISWWNLVFAELPFLCLAYFGISSINDDKSKRWENSDLSGGH